LKLAQAIINDPVVTASIRAAESISKVVQSKNEDNATAKLIASFFAEVSKLDSLAKSSIEDIFIGIYDGDTSTFSKTLSSLVNYIPTWAQAKKYEKVTLTAPSLRESGTTTIYVINEFEQLVVKTESRYKKRRLVYYKR
jgi:hypothetical protein